MKFKHMVFIFFITFFLFTGFNFTQPEKFGQSIHDICAGGGEIWTIDYLWEHSAGYPVVRWTGSNWQYTGRFAWCIAIGSNGKPWVVTRYSNVWEREEGSWWKRTRNYPQFVNNVTIDKNNNVYTIEHLWPSSMNWWDIYKWNRNNKTWIHVTNIVAPFGYSYFLDAGAGNRICVIEKSDDGRMGTVYEFIGTKMTLVYEPSDYLQSCVLKTAVGDVNNDGYHDIVYLFNDNISGLWLYDTRYHRWNRLYYKKPQTISLGDVNGNGRDDLLTGWPNNGGVWVRFSHNGTWKKYE